MFAPPIDIQLALVQHTQSVSVLIRHPSNKSYVYSQASRHIYTSSQIQQDTRYIRGMLKRVASVGCFPGAWRRGSWHFQVASLHLQSSMRVLNRNTTYVSDTWKCGSLSFIFTHPPEDLEKKKRTCLFPLHTIFPS